jgi:hypothetical protein
VKWVCKFAKKRGNGEMSDLVDEVLLLLVERQVPDSLLPLKLQPLTPNDRQSSNLIVVLSIDSLENLSGIANKFLDVLPANGGDVASEISSGRRVCEDRERVEEEELGFGGSKGGSEEGGGRSEVGEAVEGVAGAVEGQGKVSGAVVRGGRMLSLAGRGREWGK